MSSWASTSWRRSAFVGMTAAVLACGAARTVPSQPQPDSVVLEIARAALASARVMDSVWPGFWQPLAFGLYRPDTVVYLYTSEAPPAGFTPVASELPAELTGRFFRYEGRWRNLVGRHGVLDTRVPRPIMAASVTALGSRSLAMLIHEAFHVWQAQSFSRAWDDMRLEVPGAEPPVELLDTLRVSAAFTASVQAERPLLLAALRATRLDSARSLAASYLRLRNARLTDVPQPVSREERWREMMEGTATFVEIAAPELGESRGWNAVRDTLVARIQQDDRWGELGETAGEQMFRRAYLSGAGMAFLLDRLSCRDWRRRVEGGEYLDAVLETCVLPAESVPLSGTGKTLPAGGLTGVEGRVERD